MRGGEGEEPLEKALLLHVFKGSGEGELAVAVGEAALQKRGVGPVSYTHLDVYKRQRR